MPETPATARHANGRFGSGNPGRRAGSRNQVSHRLVMAMMEDFELHREWVVGLVRNAYPMAYLGIMTRLLERQLLQGDEPMEEEGPAIEARQLVAPSPKALPSREIPRAGEDPRVAQDSRGAADHRAAVARIEQTLARLKDANPALRPPHQR